MARHAAVLVEEPPTAPLQTASFRPSLANEPAAAPTAVQRTNVPLRGRGWMLVGVLVAVVAVSSLIGGAVAVTLTPLPTTLSASSNEVAVPAATPAPHSATATRPAAPSQAAEATSRTRPSSSTRSARPSGRDTQSGAAGSGTETTETDGEDSGAARGVRAGLRRATGADRMSTSCRPDTAVPTPTSSTRTATPIPHAQWCPAICADNSHRRMLGPRTCRAGAALTESSTDQDPSRRKCAGGPTREPITGFHVTG
jgi:hypothetical protein